ncbi:MAG: hypothetical protein HDR05_12605 [Lachnospiraceae bacterium]|nr:hypothetical protein [Lachnospiraceae bacterium]
MQKFKCVKKYYGKNNDVIEYDLMNENGAVQTYDKDAVKQAITKKKIEVINLQISSDGRLVDKAVKLEKTPNNQEQTDIQQILTYAYEYAYRGLMHGEVIQFIRMESDNENIFCGEIYKVLKRNNLDRKLNAMQVAQGFENYIRQKYNCLPLKLNIRCKEAAQVHVILYSNMNIVYFNIACFFTNVLHLNSEKEIRDLLKIYLNENNYEITGGSLNPSQPKPIYLRGTSNEKEGNKIRIKGNAKELSKNVPYIIVEKGASDDKDYANLMINIGLTIGLKSNHIIIDENTGKVAKENSSMNKGENYPTLIKGFKKLVYSTIGKRFYATALGKMFLMFDR